MILNKIKILSVMVGLILALAMVPMVIADTEFGNVIEGGKLLITDMDVKVGSKTDKNLGFGDTISEEAKPGDIVQFSIEVTNNFTRDEDLEIEDIDVTVTIFDIDDGDDLDQDAKEFDLKAGKDDSIDIEFEIALEVEEDTYDVLIEIEGEDENGTTHAVQYELQLEVQKEDNEVRFTRNSLTPSEIKCGRSVQLSTAVINTGADDEDDVVLEVSNVELGISFRETFDLSNDAFDDDSKFSKTFTFNMPEDVAPGIYSIQSRVIFNDGKDIETETAELVVNQCEIFVEEEAECETDDDCGSNEVCEDGECVEEEEEVVVVQPPVTSEPETPTGMTTGEVTTPVLPATEEKSLFETQGFLIALIAGEVLLLLIAILLIVVLFRKRG
ncbi:hypothetical protein KY347_06250 [Candidatus Woesearchaeota archaeon]|nr:hypothetical protein [Candidatus Woesearchaeota archaeon]